MRTNVPKVGPSLVDTDHVLALFSKNKARSRTRYVDFMRQEDSLKKGEVYATIDQRLQGSDEFVDRVQTLVETEIKKERKKKEVSLPQICNVVEKRYGVAREQLQSFSNGTEAYDVEKSLCPNSKDVWV